MPKDQPVDELAEKLLALPTHNKPLLFDVDELVKLIQAECNRARLNLIDYFDQVPTNDSMDWKGLFSDTRKIVDAELQQLLKGES